MGIVTVAGLIVLPDLRQRAVDDCRDDRLGVCGGGTGGEGLNLTASLCGGGNETEKKKKGKQTCAIA